MKLKKYNEFVNESKVATDESPLGYYDIANAVMPDEMFNKLETLEIKWKHDRYRNLIEIFVKDESEAKIVRDMVLDMYVLDGSDIDEDHLKYEWPTKDDIGDALEIKLK